MNTILLATEASIDEATATRRVYLVGQLDQLPNEAFTRLQYLQVQVGCFNRCAFCSQQAGVDIWQVSAAGLADLVAALKTVTARRGVRLGADRHLHRPGVLFPYLDNDIASYPHLEQLVEHCARDLHVKLRLSTVGYSRHHQHLAAAHQRIVADRWQAIDGIRFSLTPYAVGYRIHRDEYLADLAAALRTWKPYLDKVGPGAATAAVELRFPPLVYAVNAPLFDEIVDGRHVIACPPHLLVSAEPVTGRPSPTAIKAVVGREASFTRPGSSYLHLISDKLLATAAHARTARQLLAGELDGPRLIRRATVHAWTNADGPYYAIDPAFTVDGRYRALHLYAQTGRRIRSGYTDATRWFLNALLAHKASRSVSRRDPFPHATTADIRAVLDRLTADADRIAVVDARAATHLTRQVLPLVHVLAAVLEEARYTPAFFFDPRFTIDTGQIVNQGNAKSLFLGLAATTDEPMTPREERGYGHVSLSSVRGTVWRIAPTPTTPGPLFRVGGKNTVQPRPSLVVEELDPQHLRPVERTTARPLRRYVLDGVDTETLELTHADALRAYPGAACDDTV